MNALQLLVALLNSSGTLIPVITKVVADIQAGKGTTPLTDADWAALVALAAESSASIYAREGVPLPPPASV